MKKLLLSLLLAVVSSSAMAEWVEVTTSDDYETIIYVDPTTIRKSGNNVKMWILYDYKETQDSDSSKPFRSYKDHYEYDCKEDQGRSRYQTFHTKNMGSGVVNDKHNYQSEWAPLPPDSIGAFLLNFACGK